MAAAASAAAVKARERKIAGGQQRLRAAKLGHDEAGRRASRAGQASYGGKVRPPPARSFDEEDRQGAQHRHGEQLAACVDAASDLAGRFGHAGERQPNRERANWNREKKNPAPAGVTNNGATQRGSHHPCEAVTAGPGADGARPLRCLGIGIRKDRQRNGNLQGGAQSRQHAPADQGGVPGGRAAQQ